MKTFFQLSCFVCLLSYSFACTAEQNLDAKSAHVKLNKLQQKIKQLQNSLEGINSSKDNVEQQLKQTLLNINELHQELFHINNNIQILKKEFQQLSDDYHAKKDTLNQHQRILAKQLISSFHTGKQEFVKLILNQQEPAVFNRIMRYYQYFNQARVNQIEQVKQLLLDVEQQRQDVLNKQRQINQQKKLYEQQQAQLEQQKKQQNKLIATLSTRQKNATAELERLLADEKQLKLLLDKIQLAIKEMNEVKPKKPFASLKGKLFWPTYGNLRKLFGHWRSMNRVKWRGNIITNSEGSPVYSISHGRVVYADWLRGYGLLIIIDHGDGYMSLYGHNESLLKSVGDNVNPGETVATSGRSGGRSEAGSYFEIRKNSRPINPARWCVKMPSAPRG